MVSPAFRMTHSTSRRLSGGIIRGANRLGLSLAKACGGRSSACHVSLPQSMVTNKGRSLAPGG